MSTMSAKPLLHIIGLGVHVPLELPQYAVRVLHDADMIIGSERQLELLNDSIALQQQHLEVLPKLSQLRSLIDNNHDKTVVILASGDPLYYGIGRWCIKQFGFENCCFYPGVSSIQAACHQLGLSLQDVIVLSLHGRPLQKIRRQLKRNTRLLVLTDKNSSPKALARECYDAGFDQSIISVCEKLGDPQQRIRHFSVTELLNSKEYEVDPLHVSCIEVKGEGGVLPEFPGIPDEHFITGAEPGKGMISKREVRLSILSLLQPASEEIIWDIGAGCGGVAIELAYWSQHSSIYAVEYHAKRLEYLAANRQRFGVASNLHIVEGRAPDILPSLPNPHKVFIGGSDGELTDLLPLIWQQLPVNGMLVASAVIDSTQEKLAEFAVTLAEQQVQIIEVAVTRGKLQKNSEHKQLQYQAKLPVTIFAFTKYNR